MAYKKIIRIILNEKDFDCLISGGEVSFHNQNEDNRDIDLKIIMSDIGHQRMLELLVSKMNGRVIVIGGENGK